jgi:hypothetical protein
MWSTFLALEQMMSELIVVDFKKREVVKRTDLEAPIPAWSAAKDPDFKAFVEGMVAVAEAMQSDGLEWRRMVIVAGEGDTCFSVFDSNTWGAAEVIETLEFAVEKIATDYHKGEEGEPS